MAKQAVDEEDPKVAAGKHEVRRGHATTEFWVSVGTAVVGSLLAAGALGTGPVAIAAGAVMAGLAAVGYGHSRATVKAAAAARGP